MTSEPHRERSLVSPAGPTDLWRLDQTLPAAEPERTVATASAAPGKVGRFAVLERIGEGGMGVVYAAYDELLDRKVALKLLHAAGLADGGGDDRLLREAQAMARLSHPNIVSVYEVGSFGQQHFIAMEFVRGQTLDAWIGTAPRDWSVVLPVLLAAGRGLAAAHQAGIIHRDYKPHNTLVGADGSVKVADFGLARSNDITTELAVDTPREPDDAAALTDLPHKTSSGRRLLHETLTQHGVIVGTPAYMAPEQHASQPCDARSDQFSYCVTVYQSLYGALPFPTTSLEALLAAIATGRVNPAPPNSTVPLWIRRAILRGLSPDPDQRWPSMPALLDALARDPALARRKRLRIFLSGASLALLGLSAGWLANSLSTASSCPDSAAELRGVWDEARRQQLSTTILATNLPFAPTTWSHLQQNLQRYADAWTSLRHDSCESHRAGRLSDTQYDLRMRCLDQRRTDLAVLTDVLASTDATSLERAALADAALPPIAPCADLEALLGDPLRPPSDPALAPVVDRVLTGLATVRALEATGQLSRTLAAIDDLTPDAAATRHLPFLAELALYRGRALLQSDPQSADAALTTAVHDALRSGHDVVATEALARRIFVRGYSLARHHDALLDEQLVLPLLDRIHDDGRLRGEYLNNIGAVSFGRNQLNAAEAHYSAAISAKSAAFGPDSGELVYTYANLGTLRNSLSRTAAAISAFEAATAVGTRTFGAEHPVILQVRTNLGGALSRHARLHAAESTLLAVRAAADRADLVAVAKHLADISLIRRDAAAAALHVAAARAASPGDPLSVAMIAAIQTRIAALDGDEAAARRHHAEQRAALSAVPDHPLSHELDIDLADIELDLGHPAAALALATTAATVVAQNSLGHVQARERQATAYHALGRRDEALAAATEALALLESIVDEQNPRVAATLTMLATVEAAADRPQLALAHIQRAHQILAATADPDHPTLALVRFQLARQTGDRPLATTALATLRAAGPGFLKDVAAIEAWLATP